MGRHVCSRIVCIRQQNLISMHTYFDDFGPTPGVVELKRGGGEGGFKKQYGISNFLKGALRLEYNFSVGFPSLWA